MNPYSYPRDKLHANLQLRQTTPSWLRYTIDFPTAHPTRHEKNNTVHGEYFQPRDNGHAPLVILSHGMGDELLIPCKLLARALAKKGMACFVPYSVFHSRRMPETVRKRLHSLSPEEWFESYRISVIDMRQIIDWASSKSEVNKEQVAAIGISFGGFISAITMGVDKRIGAGVFITTAGNSEKISWKSRKSTMRKWYQRTEVEYNKVQSCYAQYLAEVAKKGLDNVTPARESFLIDPLTFAPYLKGRPVLMLNALWDEYIPKEATIDFWEACGKPALTWFPATHSTIWLLYPLISRKIAHFLRSTFGIQDRFSV
ncbi:alpha/beta hydrolase family protein [Chloroflexota bacterium]